MNSVSWFIYIAGAVGKVNIFVTLLCVALSLLVVVSTFCGFVCSVEAHGAYSTGGDKKWADYWFKMWRWLWVPVLFVWFLFCALPSSGTLYAIAASQMGEKAVNSELGQELLTDGQRAVRAWIKTQLEHH